MQPGGLGGGAPDGEQLVELSVHAGEAVAAELLGVEIQFEVERPDFSRVRVIGQGGEHRQCARGRLPRRVDEKHFLLGTDAPDPGLEAIVAQHRLQRLEVAQHPTDRRLPVSLSSRRLLAHQCFGLTRSLAALALSVRPSFLEERPAAAPNPKWSDRQSRLRPWSKGGSQSAPLRASPHRVEYCRHHSTSSSR